MQKVRHPVGSRSFGESRSCHQQDSEEEEHRTRNNGASQELGK